MKQVLLIIIIICFSLQLLGSVSHAHAIRYELENSGVVTIRSYFDDLQPAGGMSVIVMQPRSEDVSQTGDRFQTGKTDINGRFSFCPDRAGKWDVLVFDHMGHRLEIEIPVDESMKAAALPEKGFSDLRYPKIALGIALIIIVFGMMGWGRSRRRK